MSADAKASDFFVAGGTLHPDVPSYVKRSADDELFNLALAGEFCYVLTPRQMGKSSLMIRTAKRLGEQGLRTAIIDLTRIGTDITVEQWYLSLLTQLKRRLRLSVDPVAWWQARASLGYVQCFTDFLRDVILTQIEEQVVIFIDEIDTTLNFDFRDDFFAAIRAMYNARADDPEFDRLTFVLLGVASPPDLIKDRARTPFNIGQGIAVQEFSRTDAAVLQARLETLYPGQGEAIFARICHWTNGHPYLTQKLCLAVAETGDDLWTSERVDDLVERLFLSEEARKETNLQFVQDKILTHPQRRKLLGLYKSVAGGKEVEDDGQSPIQNQLKLSGIIKAQSGYLCIRNEIYRRAFNLAWIRKNAPTNWASIVAGIAVFVALLAVGSIIYDALVDTQVTNCVASFYQASTSEEQVTHLARIFRLQGIFAPTDYDDTARGLFYEMEDQLALFDAYDVEESDLIVVIKGLYVTLADIDGTDGSGPLLEAMARTLDRLAGTEEAVQLREEINNWREGRELVKQNQYSQAREAYSRAIALNSENPATLYERARVLANLSEYKQALSDLDQVMAIARRAPAPAPAPSSSTVVPADLPAATTTSTSMSSTDIPDGKTPPVGVTATQTSSLVLTETPVPTPTPEPGPIVSGFAYSWQMISAARYLINSDSDLASSLASAPGSEYTNLRELGLVPTRTQPPDLPFFAGPSLDTAEILPDDWQYASTYRMDTNNDSKREWVILYHFDLPEGKTSGSPIGAIIYQPDDKSPANISAYDLRPADGDYLCECTCRPTMNDVLSGLEGDELVVSDYCDEKITRLTIFHWDPDTGTYLPKGHFCGHSITFDLNQVAVEQPWPSRAQLLMREIYRPCENNTSYRPGYQGTPEICEKRELVFAHGEPEDVMYSPYPEIIVLAFYNHYEKDEKAPTYFAEEGWEHLEQCNTGWCGCRSVRSEITHVRVVDLRPEYETYSADKDLGPDRATVQVTVVCERRNGAQEDQRSIRWHLIREDSHWQLERPE